MERYLQMLRLFWSAAIASELEYRLNFIIAAISSIGSLLGSLFSLLLFYRTGYKFQGWNWEEALIILAIFTILQGLSVTFLIPNLKRIVELLTLGVGCLRTFTDVSIFPRIIIASERHTSCNPIKHVDMRLLGISYQFKLLMN